MTLSRGRNEIYLSDLRLPRQVDSGEAFELKAALESFKPPDATLKLLRDGVYGPKNTCILPPEPMKSVFPRL